ncbi:ABC transporter permease [Pseudoxanthomonas mexicana]|uniref:ABC transporter permease n=1 Tax=Pseudoxanthomonas mexicana TaxID=128785 RepID=UPI001E55274B|nr:ABC transporter permease [Pseudoxanthomonas mexicana]
MLASFMRNRHLIAQLTRREVVSRYRGSWAGLAWSFFNPLIMLVIYTFVFTTIFKARWGAGSERSHADFALILFVGIIIHGVLAECILKAPALVTNNVSYVKKFMFPLEILPWPIAGSAMFHAMVSFLVLLLAQVVVGQGVPWTAGLFPVVVAPLLVVGMGVMWLIASTAVYVRDIAMVTGLVVTALMFLAPVFYPASALPDAYRWIILWNPLTFIIEQGRQVLIAGNAPDWVGLTIYLCFALPFAWFGYAWFQRTRKGFADVL